MWEIGLLTYFSCLVIVITTFQKSFHVRHVKSETLAYFLIGSGYRYEERGGLQSSYARLSATSSGSSSRYDGPPWNIYTKIIKININRSNWTRYQEFKTNRRQINTRSLFCLYTIKHRCSLPLEQLEQKKTHQHSSHMILGGKPLEPYNDLRNLLIASQVH